MDVENPRKSSQELLELVDISANMLNATTIQVQTNVSLISPCLEGQIHCHIVRAGLDIVFTIIIGHSTYYYLHTNMDTLLNQSLSRKED